MSARQRCKPPTSVVGVPSDGDGSVNLGRDEPVPRERLGAGRRALRHGLKLASDGRRLDSPEFYQGEVGLVSLNYDPIGLWIQFIANPL
jgi:hypothetical protein